MLYFLYYLIINIAIEVITICFIMWFLIIVIYSSIIIINICYMFMFYYSNSIIIVNLIRKIMCDIIAITGYCHIIITTAKINKFIYFSHIAVIISVYGIMFINYCITNKFICFLKDLKFDCINIDNISSILA